MRLDELHHDADELRRSGVLADAPFDAANSGNTTFDQELIHGGDGVNLDPLLGPGVQESTPWVRSGWGPQRAPAAAPPDGVTSEAATDPVMEPDAAEEPPLSPPPPAEARRRWPLSGLVDTLARRAGSTASTERATQGAPDSAPQPGTRRQINPAPWLAVGLLGIVLLAVVAGILNAGRVEDEAARAIDAKRKAAERAVGLLGGQGGGEVPPLTLPPAADAPAPEPASRLPAQGRDRHEAMLSAIKSGAVLASLPPSALAQPTPLPAELPTAAAASATRSSHAPALAAAAPLPPKKVALVVEGAPLPRATAPRAFDPLAAATVSAGLKGSAIPSHRVYQLREADGEWLGYVARADDDPLAAGVWAGSGDLLQGGWRVAEVTSQRLTLVGPGGALEILRP